MTQEAFRECENQSKEKLVIGKRMAQVVLEKLGLILATRAPLTTSGVRLGSSQHTAATSELNLPQMGF